MSEKQDIRELAPTYESLAALYEAIQSIGATLDLEEVLNKVIQAAVGLLDAEWGFIVWEPEKGIEVRACAVLSPDAIDDPALELALCATEAHTGRTPASRVYIVSPLWSPAEETACALYLDRPPDQEPFSDADLKLLKAFVDQATVAIQNAYAFYDAASAEVEFVSMIAHDLRLPTTNVRGYSDLLLKETVGPMGDMQKQFLSVIHNNTYYMETLTYNLSDVAKIDHDRMPLNPVPVSLEDSINAVLDKLGPKIEEKEQALELDLPALSDVLADKGRLEQVVRIVLENAHLYTPAGGKIAVTAKAQGDFVRLTVTDTGIGISPEDQETRLFTKFFRADNPVVQEHKGGGNNLYVAKRLVELMGGEMGAESEPDKGSTFWFTLPVANTEENAGT
ncbi:MAG: HAMP domain-containing histidine kinase [Anaerolineae bacterium]|nr:HAMP domain-containing histidine kinase [Anaerolineae bacterium]